MRGNLWRWIVACAYWIAVFFILRRACPVWFDGGGPMPSFYWGRELTPSLDEYYRRQDYYEFIFGVPYAAASLVATVIGCVLAPALVRRFRPDSTSPARQTAVVTAICLVLLALGSDTGGILGLWNGPLFFLHRYFLPYDALVLSQTFLLPSILAGLVAAIPRRAISDPSPPSAAGHTTSR